MGQGISEPRAARTFLAKVPRTPQLKEPWNVELRESLKAEMAGPPWGRASPRSESGGGLRPQWSDFLSSALRGSLKRRVV
eukprot:2879521-Pyramimonas_sp.AAC.1